MNSPAHHAQSIGGLFARCSGDSLGAFSRLLPTAAWAARVFILRRPPSLQPLRCGWSIGAVPTFFVLLNKLEDLSDPRCTSILAFRRDLLGGTAARRGLPPPGRRVTGLRAPGGPEGLPRARR